MWFIRTTLGVLALAGTMLLSVSVELARGQCVPHETDKVFGGSGSNSYFGERVSIDGDRAIVGAYGPGDFTGAAYIFERTPGLPNSSWNQVAAFSDTAEHQSFGRAVSIDGDTAIIGTGGSSTNPIIGKAYIVQGQVGLTVRHLLDQTPACRTVLGPGSRSVIRWVLTHPTNACRPLGAIAKP